MPSYNCLKWSLHWQNVWRRSALFCKLLMPWTSKSNLAWLLGRLSDKQDLLSIGATTLGIMTFSIMTFCIMAELCYAEGHLCCHLCCVTYKLSVDMLIVIMLNVAAASI
jgi:hypothetical protein